MKWEPIGSAPKDGSYFLAIGPRMGYPAFAYFSKRHQDYWNTRVGAIGCFSYWCPIPSWEIAYEELPPGYFDRCAASWSASQK